MKNLVRIASALLLLIPGRHLPLKAQTQIMKNKNEFRQLFPQGRENPPMNARYFIGQSYLAPLTHDKTLNCPVYNVTFEPGCRNNWHSHTGGQLLIVTAGRGYYQEQGQPARELMPGDIVEIAPETVHWHGAAPDSWFSHLAVECNPQTNQNTWLGPVDDEQYAAATGPAHTAAPNFTSGAACENLRPTDPELAQIFEDFVSGEVQQYGSLSSRTRILVTMASAIAQQATSLYERLLPRALEAGITPVEIKETLYQTVPYAGMAKAAEFIDPTNEFLTANGIRLPLEPQSATTPETRFEKGLALQKEIFGDAIEQMHRAAPDNQRHIQHYLTANCFGDYQTRTGLDVKTRELLTFATLVSLGGCEPQVKAHIQGNVNAGNDKSVLLAVATQLLPYIGYPRTLNAIACLNEVIPENR